jgi:hypothetical protein
MKELFLVIENTPDWQQIEIIESELEAKGKYNTNKESFDPDTSNGGALIKIAGDAKIYSSYDWNVEGAGELISSYSEDDMGDD